MTEQSRALLRARYRALNIVVKDALKKYPDLEEIYRETPEPRSIRDLFADMEDAARERPDKLSSLGQTLISEYRSWLWGFVKRTRTL